MRKMRLKSAAFALPLMCLTLAQSSLVAKALPGSLDTTFGSSGRVSTDFGDLNEYVNGCALQSDSKLVVVGTKGSSGSDVAILRYTTGGVLDTTFGTGGKVTYNSGGSNTDSGEGVAIQSDGKIVVVGFTTHDFIVLRYNSNGTLDTTFDGDGKVLTDFGDDTFAYDVAIQSDGKIVVVGKIEGGTDMAIARYNTNGSLDTSFDGDGKKRIGFGGTEAARAVAIQSDGKIVLVGEKRDGNVGSAIMARCNADGSLDTSFDSDGLVETDLGGTYDSAYDVTLQSDGKIVVAGATSNSTFIEANSDLVVLRYNTNGSLDTTFGTSGKVQSSVGRTATGVAVQANGKIVASSWRVSHISSDGLLLPYYECDFVLIRLNSNGTFDTTFNTDGIVVTNFYGNSSVDVQTTSSEIAHDIVIQSDGKIIAVGQLSPGATEGTNFAAARYIGDTVTSPIQKAPAANKASSAAS